MAIYPPPLYGPGGAPTGVGPRARASGNPGGGTLASVGLTAGRATFGQAFPQGAVPDGRSVALGGLDTQVDPLTTWPDGSLKFAAISAAVADDGDYDLAAGSPATGTFAPTIPAVVVTIDEQEWFAVLGTYAVGSGTLRVTLANDADPAGDVVADCVRIHPVADPSSVTRVDDGGAGFSATGTWTTLADTGYRRGGVRYATGSDGSAVATWTFAGLAPGDYVVAATWVNYTRTPYAQTTSAAPFRVYDDETLLGTVEVRQDGASLVPADVVERYAYTATMPGSVSSDPWLDGPVVREWRHAVDPVDGSDAAHPWLRVLFDCRAYDGGAGRVWVAVENCRDVALATMVPYDLAVSVDGAEVLSKAGLRHWWGTRWVEPFDFGGLSESEVTPDFGPFHEAKALPRVRSDVPEDTASNPGWAISGDRWDILQRGGLTYNQFDQGGGRDELGFYPSWVICYLRHKAQASREFAIRSARRAASFPVHVLGPDDAIVDVRDRPEYLLEAAAIGFAGSPAANVVTGTMAASDPLYADRQHQYALAYPAYLLTAERCLHDEMRAYALWNTYNNSTLFRAGGSPTQWDSACRSQGWPLRNLAEAAAYLRDGDEATPILELAISATLDAYDGYAAGTVAWPQTGRAPSTALDGDGEYGSSFEDPAVGDGSPAYLGHVGMWATWQQAYMVYAIRRCNDLGYAGGLDLADRMAGFGCRQLDSAPGWPTTAGISYYPILGTHDGEGNWAMEATMAGVYALNAGRAALGPGAAGQLGWPWDYTEEPNGGTWPAYAMLLRAAMATWAADRGLAHGAEAKAAIDVYLGVDPGAVAPAYALADPWY